MPALQDAPGEVLIERDTLQAEVARLAARATERLVVENLDQATQAELLEQFIARVGAGTTNGTSHA